MPKKFFKQYSPKAETLKLVLDAASEGEERDGEERAREAAPEDHIPRRSRHGLGKDTRRAESQSGERDQQDAAIEV